MTNQIINQMSKPSDSQIHLVDSGLVALSVGTLCLLLTTFSADRLASAYLDRVQQSSIHSWNLAVRYSDSAAGLFVVLQMIMFVVVFGIAGRPLRVDRLRRLLRVESIEPVLWGVFMGIGVSFVSSPLLFLFDKHTQFVRLLIDNPFSLQTILIILLLALLVPISTEIVFRGIIFDGLERKTNALVAGIVSSLVFAYVWVLLDAGVALIIGIACALLYRRFNSLVPGIICSGIVSVVATLILFLRLLLQAGGAALVR